MSVNLTKENIGYRIIPRGDLYRIIRFWKKRNPTWIVTLNAMLNKPGMIRTAIPEKWQMGQKRELIYFLLSIGFMIYKIIPLSNTNYKIYIPDDKIQNIRPLLRHLLDITGLTTYPKNDLYSIFKKTIYITAEDVNVVRFHARLSASICKNELGEINLFENAGNIENVALVVDTIENVGHDAYEKSIKDTTDTITTNLIQQQTAQTEIKSGLVKTKAKVDTIVKTLSNISNPQKKVTDSLSDLKKVSKDLNRDVTQIDAINLNLIDATQTLNEMPSDAEGAEVEYKSQFVQDLQNKKIKLNKVVINQGKVTSKEAISQSSNEKAVDIFDSLKQQLEKRREALGGGSDEEDDEDAKSSVAEWTALQNTQKSFRFNNSKTKLSPYYNQVKIIIERM